MMNDNSWMNNPALGGIDPAKLKMLSSLAEQAQGKSQSELLAFLMATMSQSQAGNMSFSPAETEAIINVMKIGKTPRQIQKIDRMCAMIRQARK